MADDAAGRRDQMTDAAGMAGAVGPRQERRTWRAYVLACLLNIPAILIGEAWAWLLGPRNLSLPFIIAIMLAGRWFGLGPAVVAALVGFEGYNYFLTPPRLSMNLAPVDLLALLTFVIAALFAGAMAGQLSDRARAATDRLGRVISLFAASRDLSAAGTRHEVAENLVGHLRAAGVPAAIWSGSDPAQLLAAAPGAPGTPPPPLPGSDRQAGPGAEALWIPLATARGRAGVVGLSSASFRLEAARKHWIDALLQLGAIALDRAALAVEVSEARLVAEREGLRTALLSSLSHDLRTPIAAILASASGLAENEDRFDRLQRREFVQVIQDEAERLNLYVSNLLEMTRLDSGALKLSCCLVDPADAMAAALQRMRRRLAGRRVVRDFAAAGGLVWVDPILLEQALVNVIENAAAFSPPGAAIRAEASAGDEWVRLSIVDEGPGVASADLPHVFERFFRGGADRKGARAGVGLGLSVARGIVEAFDGAIGLESPASEGRGARVTIRLPAHAGAPISAEVEA